MNWLKFALLAIVPFVIGCSTFNRDWRALDNAQLSGIEGKWTGRWLSDANGHNGKLRCIISKSEDGTYLSRYRASYQWILRFEYAAPLEVSAGSGKTAFTGQADLGKLAGGTYHYKGDIVKDRFSAEYRSKYDHGIFEMQRE